MIARLSEMTPDTGHHANAGTALSRLISDAIERTVNLEDATFYVAIELSEKSWVGGLKAPGSGKVGFHVPKPSDTPALIALIERHREAEADMLVAGGAENGARTLHIDLRH